MKYVRLQNRHNPEVFTLMIFDDEIVHADAVAGLHEEWIPSSAGCFSGSESLNILADKADISHLKALLSGINRMDRANLDSLAELEHQEDYYD